MLAEVASDSLIQDQRSPFEDVPINKWERVCSNSLLQIHKSFGTDKWNTHLVIAQLVFAIFPQKRIQLDHICTLDIKSIISCTLKA